MFSLFNKFVFYTFLNIFVGLNGLVELPKFEVADLIATEQIIRNSTNSVLSSLKLVKPANFTRIRDYATTLHHFLSSTFQDLEILNEIARLTRADKRNNKTGANLTTILNELLDESSREFKTSDVGTDESDASVTNYINGFLAKLEELKEYFGVNKVISDINANIIKIFGKTNKTITEVNGSVNVTKDTGVRCDIFDSGEFWQESGRRIFKGTNTKIKYFPFIASVHIFNSFQCAGSIIKSDLVITASSCLQLAWNNRLYRENPAFLSVRVGSSFYTSGGENIPVLEIYFHPEYNPKNLRNNVCVMRLVRHLKFRYADNRKIRKIAIDDQASNLPINIPGITILGWGAKGASGRLGSPWSNVLSYAVLDVYPLRECQDVFNKEYVTNRNFCGGFFSKGGGACNRDVGGPGVVNGLLMGVVSFGSPVCGTPDVPTVFTKLGYYYDWIQNIMDMEIPRGLRGSTRKISRDPFGIYMTTPYTTTTFKIEPLKPGWKPKPALKEDQANLLRNLDGNLFQEFLRTMFGEDETQKYQYLIEQMKKKQLIAEMKKPNKEMKELGRENVVYGSKDKEKITQNQISKPAVNKENAVAETYHPLTSGYDSENYLYPSTVQSYNTKNYAPSTALMFTGNGKVTEDDYPVTEMTRSQPELYYETPLKGMTRGQHELYYETPVKVVTHGQPELYYETPVKVVTHGQPELYYETPVKVVTHGQPELYYETPAKVVTHKQPELYHETPVKKMTHGQPELYYETPVTKYTRGKPKKETRFIPITQHAKDIARNDEISYAPKKNKKVTKSISSTSKLPAEIELQLAMESSDDESDDYVQLPSHNKDNKTIKAVVEESQSEDISDIPGEDALAKLLDQIDLDQIIKEVSMDSKHSDSEIDTTSKSKSPVKLFKTNPTTLASRGRNEERKVENYENIDKLDKNINEAVLTLLYLSDTEKANNFPVEFRNFGDYKKNDIDHRSTLGHLTPSESLYNIVPKSNVYKIITEVINAAMENKKKIE